MAKKVIKKPRKPIIGGAIAQPRTKKPQIAMAVKKSTTKKK